LYSRGGKEFIQTLEKEESGMSGREKKRSSGLGCPWKKCNWGNEAIARGEGRKVYELENFFCS